MRHSISFALFLLFAGTLFAGTIVNVGETVPVGGTTTTTTTTTTTPSEPEESEGGEMPAGPLVLTNEEGDSIAVGGPEGGIVPLEGAEGSAAAPGGSVGLPSGGANPAHAEGEAPLCGAAFALLALAAFAAKRS
jgi:hypothetical protein